MSKTYTNLRCLLDIVMLTQQAKGAGAIVAYCSGESTGRYMFNV